MAYKTYLETIQKADIAPAVSGGGDLIPKSLDAVSRAADNNPRDDYSDNISTTGLVTVGGSVAGNIEVVDDRDWFAVTLQAGRDYTINLEGADTQQGTLARPIIYGGYDAAGTSIPNTMATDGGTGNNPRLLVTTQDAGKYYICVGAFSGTLGTYKLSVLEGAGGGGEDDYLSTTATAGHVMVGGSAAGSIGTANDSDWFHVTLVAGTPYTIDLEGSPTGQGNLSDPAINGVYDASGAFVTGTAMDDGGTGYNSRLYFTPTTSGSYYISAGAVGAVTGTYKLSVSGASYQDYLQTIQGAYIAYYQRPADSAGEIYWAQRLADAGGDVAAIVDAFGNSAESVALFGSTTDASAKITSIYLQMFGRSPDAGGLQFYANLVNSGQKSLASVALDIYNGATGDDGIMLANKLAVADSFTAAASLHPSYVGDVAEASRTMLSSVDATDGSRTAALGSIDPLLESLVRGRDMSDSPTRNTDSGYTATAVDGHILDITGDQADDHAVDGAGSVHIIGQTSGVDLSHITAHIV